MIQDESKTQENAVQNESAADTNENGQSATIASMQEELAKQKEYYLRIVADCEDRMRRCKQDAVHSINVAIENLTRDLIPLMSDIAQALTICDGATKTGLEMIEKNLKGILKKYGIEEIAVEVGAEFDPNLHHAIGTQEHAEISEGKIISVVQRGYKLHDKVVAAAMVIVAK